MPRVRVGDRDLFYETEGDGEPLLLLSGLGADHHLFDLVRADLGRQHRLLLVDNRDAGASDEARGAYGLGDMAQDALGVIDHLGIDRFHVLGASMGGAIAQHVALAAPTRAATLVLASTWGRTDAMLRAIFEGWRIGIGRLTAEQFLAAQAPWVFGHRCLAAPSAEIVALRRAVQERGWPRSVAAYERQVDACLAHDLLGVLVILQTPTLVLVGEDDILTPPRYGRALASTLGRAEVTLLPVAAHAAVLESPKPFADRVLRFLARHRLPQGQAA